MVEKKGRDGTNGEGYNYRLRLAKLIRLTRTGWKMKGRLATAPFGSKGHILEPNIPANIHSSEINLFGKS